MDEKEIRELQDKHGLSEMQSMIDSGNCWLLEGHYGRMAMAQLEEGTCFLPEVAHRDYYGNEVPGRHMLEAGSKGTLERAIEFWTGRSEEEE